MRTPSGNRVVGRGGRPLRMRRSTVGVLAGLVVAGTAAGATAALLPDGSTAAFVASGKVTGNAFTAATVAPPTGLAATTGTDPGVTLTWTASASGFIAGYKVQRAAAAAGPYADVATVPGAAATSYTDAGAPVGTDYYRVVAYAAQWTSAPTDPVAVAVVDPVSPSSSPSPSVSASPTATPSP